jgi:hypothetical protein
MVTSLSKTAVDPKTPVTVFRSNLVMQLHKALLMLYLSAAAASAQPALGDAFRELLPIGSVELSVLGVAADPEMEEIAARVQAGFAENPEWAAQYLQEIATLAPGEIAPYHENLGISEEEYELLLSAADNPQVTSIGSLELQISQVDRGLRIVAPHVEALGEIIVDLPAVGVQTADGYLNDCREVLPDQENAAIGRWSGVSCRLEQVNPLLGDARDVRFSVGRIQQSNGLYIGYRSQIMENGVLIQNVQLNLRKDEDR